MTRKEEEFKKFYKELNMGDFYIITWKDWNGVLSNVRCQKNDNDRYINSDDGYYSLEGWKKEEKVEEEGLMSRMYIGLKDAAGNKIHEGDTIKGFDRTFKIKFGAVDVEKVASNGDINTVQIPCFYFEDVKDGEKVFPIKNNYLGKNDLEDLKICEVGRVNE